MLSKDDFIKLYSRAQRKDKAAENELAEIVKEVTRPVVERMLRLNHPLRRTTDPSDIIQETFLKLIRCNIQVRELENPAAFLRKVAQNAFRDAFKIIDAKKRNFRRERRGAKLMDRIKSSEPTPSQVAIASEIEAKLDSARKGLST